MRNKNLLQIPYFCPKFAIISQFSEAKSQNSIKFSAKNLKFSLRFLFRNRSNEKTSLKDEISFLENILKTTKRRNKVFLLAESDDKVVGTVSIELDKFRRNHVGKLGIAIREGYRGIGLGKYLMSEIIKLAKRGLKPKPKIIQLEVYANNKPAINLYKKMGFKMVAKIPKQVQYKGKLIDDFIMILYIKK